MDKFDIFWEKFTYYYHKLTVYLAIIIGLSFLILGVTFLIRRSQTMSYAKETIKNLNFIQDSTLNPYPSKTVEKPYIAFLISEEDRKAFGSDSRLYINDTDLFSKPSSIKTIFFISVERAESKHYNTTQTTRSGPINNKSYGHETITSYGVYLWTYDVESMSFISFRYFYPIPLEESYEFTNSNNDNSFVPESSVKEYIDELFMIDAN
jgi:hypothetical protein